MNKIASRFKKIIYCSIAMEVFDLIVGITLFLCTSLSIKICAVITGALVLVHGLFNLIRYFYDGLASKFFSMDLVPGVASIILGLFLIFNSFDSINLFASLFAVWLILVGLHRLFYGIKLIKLNDQIYPLVCMISILITIMGCLILFNPFEAFMLVTRLMGIFILVNTAFEIMTLCLYKDRVNVVLDMFN